MPKSNRLRCRHDFEYMRQMPKKIKTESFVVFHKKSRLDKVEGRLGISVSRKLGSAVIRNRAKRLIREFFRRSTLKSSGRDILFVCQNGILAKMNHQKYVSTELEMITTRILNE